MRLKMPSGSSAMKYGVGFNRANIKWDSEFCCWYSFRRMRRCESRICYGVYPSCLRHQHVFLSDITLLAHHARVHRTKSIFQSTEGGLPCTVPCQIRNLCRISKHSTSFYCRTGSVFNSWNPLSCVWQAMGQAKLRMYWLFEHTIWGAIFDCYFTGYNNRHRE